MVENTKLNIENLENVSGGNDGQPQVIYGALPAVESGYLALRNAPVYDDSNIIAQIWPGNWFTVNTTIINGNYMYAYYNNCEGWVDRRYIQIP